VTERSESTPDVADALEQVDRARWRFVVSVAQELRAPVGELRTMAEEIADGDAARIRDELAPALVSRARMVEHLLDDLLLASDLTTELPGGEPEPVDLIATAQAGWDAMETGAELKLEGEHEAVVLLRDGAADQVLNRVLDNARRYGEAPFCLHTEFDGDMTRFTVSSDGPVLNEDLELAFEVFYRGEGAITAAPGFGLGLPVARALARQHGGDIRLAPRPTGGLDVTIELPSA
jgi:signal transduction histidine kinase